ncbi:MAG: hypothetical protein WC700_20150 [Gemmatimonadaceae bacterium]|jgi:hypothetical protein
MDETHLMIALNGAVCFAAIFMCACRLSHMSARTTKVEIRASYVVWLPTMVASALSWTYGDAPSLTQLSLGLAVLAHLSIGVRIWRHGPPAYARIDCPTDDFLRRRFEVGD